MCFFLKIASFSSLRVEFEKIGEYLRFYRHISNKNAVKTPFSIS